MNPTVPNAKGRAQVRNLHMLTMCFSEVGFWNFRFSGGVSWWLVVGVRKNCGAAILNIGASKSYSGSATREFLQTVPCHHAAAALLCKCSSNAAQKCRSSAAQKCSPAPRKKSVQCHAKMRPSAVQKFNGGTKRKWSSGATALCGSGAILEH